MTLAIIAGNALLIASALFLAGRSYRVGEKHDHTASMVISLSAAFIACSGTGALLLQGTDQDSVTFRRLLDNLAYFAAIPLIASAMFDCAWKKEWSRAAWGRWLLVLFALFELCRRSEVGITYSQALAGLSALALLISCLRMQPLITKAAGTASAIAIAVSTLVYSQASLMPHLADPALYHSVLAVALILLSIALGKEKLP
ncbi:hypothetical protein ACMXYO_02195 [Neptuniibacter sp. QD37_6]|uniref:hypothetical protein n=1 Tax=Neptuniibacter sp. QD37_6 TaxID=3398210 RepID=UPI0039F46B81